ncbi:MAG: hypothetical protein WED13_00575, partial [Methyloceanibacter sp.]
MSRKLARLKYPAFALIAGAIGVVALYFAGARVTSPVVPNEPTVRADDVASGSRSAAVEATQTAPSNIAQVSRSRSAMQAGQAAPANIAQVSRSRSAAMQATQTAPSNVAQVSRSRSAMQAGQAAPSNVAQVSRSRSAAMQA